MAYKNQKHKLLPIFVLLPLVLLFVFAYYKSANNVKKPYQVSGNKYYNHEQSRPWKSQILANPISIDQVYLQKDEKIIINKTGLVFRGFSRGIINMELYLLELDPEIPYLLSFSEKSFQKGFWVDNALYRLDSVRKHTLRLIIENSF